MSDEFLESAIQEARKRLESGGIPIGSVLVIDGKLVGRGHNHRVERGSSILHAEMDCLENAGRLFADLASNLGLKASRRSNKLLHKVR